MKMFIAPDITGFANFDAEPTIFLAGSIEQGAAVDWQTEVINALTDQNCIIFNPRRATWDSSWVQDISNPIFKAQVDWELDHIGISQIIFFYFQADTLSPISLMELGIVSEQLERFNMSAVVICEPGFWRRGNVQVLCARAKIPVFDTLAEGIPALKDEIAFWN
jgi:hypothetical protein